MFYLRLGSFGDGSLELHVELLSERDGLVVVALEPRLLRLLYTQSHSTETRNDATNETRKKTKTKEEDEANKQPRQHRGR